MDEKIFGTIYEAVPKFYHSPGFKRIMMESMENLAFSFLDDPKRTIASPMEFIFYFYWMVSNIDNNDYGLEYQKEIKVGLKKYYVDFFIYDLKNPDNGLIVEIDGHDFHEKTKEQARKDKQRDRDLQKVGYKVFHYTGSSIWNNAREVINEISNELYLTENNLKKWLYEQG